MKKLTNEMIKFAHDMSIEQRASYTILWLDGMRNTEKWQLTEEEACVLIGDISIENYRIWIEDAKLKKAIQIDEEKNMRLNLLLSIHKYLTLTSPSNMKYKFFSTPIANSIFKKTSIKEFMLNNKTTTNMIEVRNFLKSKAS